jgi:Xaa-Pro aminopeptidase
MAIREILLAAALLATLAAPLGCQSAAHDAHAGSRVGAAQWPDPDLPEPPGRLAEECAQRRLELAARLGPSEGAGVVWIETQDGPELERFFQQDDFYYLSGVELPDIALALLVDEAGGLVDEVLFLPPHDSDFEVWNGRRLEPGAEAEKETGFRRTAPLSERAERLAGWAPTRVWSLAQPRVELPEGTTVDTTRARVELSALRLVKSEYEIACLRNAIDITGAALHAAAQQVRPGRHEYAPQGALEGTFLRLGAERPGFASIFGSGPNSVTLHYNKNRRRMQDGDLIVMDVGAKYRYYCADVTRTLPVNGRFSARQREVYDVVLEAQTAAAGAAQPGVTMRELDAIARGVITGRGFGPGRKYFKHGLGHWIGLDVHDVGEYGPIEPGMLFTIEPGIYIAEEGLGVRIEDDYLMTETGAVRLSTAFPSDPDEIEALLAAR